MLRKLKKSGKVHLVVCLLIAMAVLLPLVAEAETMYLWAYTHTGTIAWGCYDFEAWENARAQELTDHPSMKDRPPDERVRNRMVRGEASLLGYP